MFYFEGKSKREEDNYSYKWLMNSLIPTGIKTPKV